MKPRRKKKSPFAINQTGQPAPENAAASPPTGAIAGDDILADVLARVREAVGEDFAKVQQGIEQAMRRDWGGERAYIAKNGESARNFLSRRDQQIIAQARRGDHIPLIARRWDISVRRVQQILSTRRDAA